MKKVSRILMLSSVLSLLVVASSCKKDDEVDKNEEKEISETSETQSTQDNNRQQSEFDDVLDVSFLAISENISVGGTAGLKKGSSLCALVSLDMDAKTITIDFGEEGCTHNNITRKGKINLQYTGHYLDSGSVITTTLDNYRVQNNLLTPNEFASVEGQQVVTNKGLLTEGTTWSVEVTDGKITFPDGDVSTWESSRTRVLTDEGTTAPFDETYKISGTASGVNRDGLAYEVEIDDLVFDYACWFDQRMLPSGIVRVKPEGKVERSVDYSTEKIAGTSCDRTVTITYGVLSFPLDL